MSTTRRALIELIKDEGCAPREEEVGLSGGGSTNVYLDIPSILDTGRRLRLAAAVLGEWFDLHVLEPSTAVGGPQTASIPLSAAVGQRNLDVKWFSVRKELKGHGMDGWIQGARLDENDTVILTDDVVSTGSSLVHAYEKVSETGARVLAVIPLVDRAGLAQGRFTALDVDYWPCITHLDLDIAPLIQEAL